ncbi:RagB/SusD family nutrient uptake outer membrane protein [Arenibacter algicola]|uniref:RagB/SusD family nutrient uptake outer membrane protein n=1 Tax=Arenibacter algicola TaxID=616991 RepID=UPI001C079994|nr:RagB/SusD family nutrient uptake outer membrane protein [Arenibacter algicola]MBU2904097.1 RagB/SusD family nutrient uptake outer membrane protein [Arenibacter algicola]
MKSIINKINGALLIVFLLMGCDDSSLDLNPLAEVSSETWFLSDQEVETSLNYLFDIRFWNPNPDPLYFEGGGWLDSFSDDWANRNTVTSVTGGTINGQTSYVEDWWSFYYKGISAANRLLENLDSPKYEITEDKLNLYKANARFVRASMYSKLIFYWGDVPYIDSTLSIDEAFAIGRIDKMDVLKNIYADYDYAVSILPETYSGTQYATKGAALAMKSRIALYMEDWVAARDAAKACMDLSQYGLYPDFEELFQSKTQNSIESVFSIAQSVSLGSWQEGDYMRPENARHVSPRSNGGNMFVWPSWDLFNSFLCEDGLPIDESPLYNPQRPFDNRDPRCTATIIEFGTQHGGTIYQPHPDSLQTTNYLTGERVLNSDSRGVIQWASFNGIGWKKGYDSDWFDDFNVAPEHHVIRYADVLLIYAEAMIELNEIDASVLEAINRVRARAYKVDYTQTSDYPALTSTDQSQLRRSLRIERRMEFAWEGLRHADIVRWRLAEKVLNTKNYGMIDPPEQRIKIIEPGLWFFPETPPIDEDGVTDFTSMFNKGYIKILTERYFDKNVHYLWPIPSKEILINPNMKQNPGY